MYPFIEVHCYLFLLLMGFHIVFHDHMFFRDLGAEVIQAGYEQNPAYCSYEHTASRRGTDGSVSTAPGPLAATSGIRPAMKANEVIRMGLKRTAAPSMEAFKTDWPEPCFVRRTLRSIQHFSEQPDQHDHGNLSINIVSRPNNFNKRNAPKIPAGRESNTGNGKRSFIVLPARDKQRAGKMMNM